MDVSRTVSEIKCDIYQISPPCIFMPPLWEFPLEFCNDAWAKKTQNDAPARSSKTLTDNCICLDTIQYRHWTDGLQAD